MKREMIEQKEGKMRGLVVQLSNEYGQKVVKEVIEKWDREGNGCFAQFVLMNFPLKWLERVRQN